MSNKPIDQLRLTEMTAELVAAYVAKNSVPVVELPNLISGVHASLATLGVAPAAAEASTGPLKPAVPIKRSVTDDFIISLEDGRKLKSMKRYLSGLGMTPAEYRAKWGLPPDYPMVAPAYAKARSALARASGLGAQRRKDARGSAPEPTPVHTEEATTPAPKKKGQARKAASSL